jgi:hypothetical protein
LMEQVYGGAAPHQRRRAGLRMASRIKDGRRPASHSLSYSTARGDARVGHMLSGGVVVAGVALFLLTTRSGASLEEQVNDLVRSVLANFDAQFEWVPGPGEAVPVLQKSKKPPSKKGNRERSRRTGRTQTSGEPKPKRPLGRGSKANRKKSS